MDNAPSAEPLRAILGHHVWATLGLLDHCRQLSPEQLELTAPGTFGSIHATLEHVVRSDGGYQRRITGGARVPPPSVMPPLASLRSDMEANAARWRELLDRVDELDATHPEEPGEYPRIEHAVGLYFAQAVHHGNDHRTHICTILGAHGLEVPEFSAWEYLRFVRSGADASAGNPFEVRGPKR
jgi:uncharacterized damage-inducible protein DinB